MIAGDSPAIRVRAAGVHATARTITVFAKNEKDNLSKAEQAAAVQLSKALIASYGDRSDE